MTTRHPYAATCRKTIALLCLPGLFALCVLTGVAHAEPAKWSAASRDKLKEALIDGFGTTMGNPFPPDSYAFSLHLRTMTRVVIETTFVDFLIENVASRPTNVPPRNFGAKLGEALFANGKRRLSDDLLLTFLRVEAQMLTVATEAECAAAARQTLRREQKLSLMTRLSDAALDDYYAVIDASIRAALSKEPVAELLPEQLQAVQDYLGQYMASKLTQEELQAAMKMDDPRSARRVPDRVACRLAKYGVDAMLDARGDLQRWVVRWTFTQ
jgi:hypothetical protein